MWGHMMLYGFGHMVYVIPLGGFVGACFYKSNHMGSCLGLDQKLVGVGQFAAG